MGEPITYVGLDAHARELQVALLSGPEVSRSVDLTDGATRDRPAAAAPRT